MCVGVQAGADRTREPLQECLDLAFQHPESVHAVGLAAEAVQTGLVKLSPQQHQVSPPFGSSSDWLQARQPSPVLRTQHL